jgi:DNA-binding MarR family transcriptional regulator
VARKRSNHEFADAAQVRVALRAFTRRTEEITRLNGLSPERYVLLLLIQSAADDGRPATVTSLVRQLQTTQSSVTQLVGGAVRAGLVERVGDVADARRRFLHLTPDGLARLRRAHRALGPDRGRLADVVADTHAT